MCTRHRQHAPRATTVRLLPCVDFPERGSTESQQQGGLQIARRPHDSSHLPPVSHIDSPDAPPPPAHDEVVTSAQSSMSASIAFSFTITGAMRAATTTLATALNPAEALSLKEVEAVLLEMLNRTTATATPPPPPPPPILQPLSVELCEVLEMRAQMCRILTMVDTRVGPLGLALFMCLAFAYAQRASVLAALGVVRAWGRAVCARAAEARGAGLRVPEALNEVRIVELD